MTKTQIKDENLNLVFTIQQIPKAARGKGGLMRRARDDGPDGEVNSPLQRRQAEARRYVTARTEAASSDFAAFGLPVAL